MTNDNKTPPIPATLVPLANASSYKEFDTLEKMEVAAAKFIKSGIVPYDDIADCILIMQTARDLRIPVPFALANIYPIKGKISTGVHLIQGLLIRGGVRIDIIEDFEPIVHFMDSNGFPYQLTKEEFKAGNYWVAPPMEVNETEIAYKERARKLKPNDATQLVKVTIPFLSINTSWGLGDYRTTVKMTRGTHVVIRSYCLHEAAQAGYIGAKGKENWILQTRAMMFARAVARTSSPVGADLTLGMAEITGMMQAANMDFELNDEGVAVPVADAFKEMKEEAAEHDDAIIDESES